MDTSSPYPTAPASQALHAYEALAPFYDDFTSGYAHRSWLDEICTRARALGVASGRVLDVACGTGKSSAPLQDRGWEVWACDLSPAMVRVARDRLRLGPERCFVADMCELPALTSFDLVLCLDDSINYLEDERRLEATLAGFGRLLKRNGVAIFDLNSLHTYATVFASEFVRKGEKGRYLWRGLGGAEVEPDTYFSAEVGVGDGDGEISWARHSQRHFSEGSVAEAARTAGLQVLGRWGQSAGARMHDTADEGSHPKVVYALGHATKGGRT